MIIGCAAAGVALFHNRNVVKLAAAAFGAVMLFQLATAASGAWTASPPAHAAPTPDSGDASRPPIIHLLMDSYLGTEGMGADPAFARLREETIAFYTQHGFRLYDGAYSRHANTANSVPYILSFGTAVPAKVGQVAERQYARPAGLFRSTRRERLRHFGLGADFLDLCAGQPIDDCRQVTALETVGDHAFPDVDARPRDHHRRHAWPA